jgi:hypothetical protein
MADYIEPRRAALAARLAYQHSTEVGLLLRAAYEQGWREAMAQENPPEAQDAQES